MATSRRKPYTFDGKDYIFAKDKFNNKLQEEKALRRKQPGKKVTLEMIYDEINEKYHINPEQIKSYKKGPTRPDKDMLSDFAEVLNCSPLDFLDEAPSNEMEDSTMINTNKEKELVVAVYNEILENIDILKRIKLDETSLSPNRKYELINKGNPFIEKLQKDIYAGSLQASDKLLKKLNVIVCELIEFLNYPAVYLPSRWEDFMAEEAFELVELLCNSDYEKTIAEAYEAECEEDLKCLPGYEFLRAKYPYAPVDHFGELYAKENLEHLYVSELLNIIRSIFQQDFSELFEEEKISK